ncbi:prion-inhibition and propagation-domain-containing protein [Bisporella sp. PMI_857]|nr:prion-inhibition and propagation-domain-containing protein [Bisporella sp. PMI_857]
MLSFLRSQSFGGDYEQLCARLKVQCIRLQLWHMLVGFNPDNSTFSNQEGPMSVHHRVKSTALQVLENISCLLKEARVLKERYQLKNPLQVSDSDFKSLESCSLRAGRRLYLIRSSSLRRRIRSNQKQCHIVSLARWVMFDRRGFEDKLRRIQELMDGLEKMTAASDILYRQRCGNISSTPSSPTEPIPPPYSDADSRPPSYPTDSQRSMDTPVADTSSSRLSDNSIFDMLEHHDGMKTFLASLPATSERIRPQIRDRLTKLSTYQFKELRIDAYDELLRRQEFRTSVPFWLPAISTYHPRRNEARRKLSTLHDNRFGQLISEIVQELEDRFPHIRDNISPTVSPTSESLDQYVASNGPDFRRWGCVQPFNTCNTPPPYLQFRAAHQATIKPSASICI